MDLDASRTMAVGQRLRQPARLSPVWRPRFPTVIAILVFVAFLAWVVYEFLGNDLGSPLLSPIAPSFSPQP
jgi:hypothetical protein